METDKKKTDWLMGIDKKRLDELDDQIGSLSTMKYVKEMERRLAGENKEAKNKYDEIIEVISEKLEKLRVERQLLLMGRGVKEEQDNTENADTNIKIDRGDER
jgi:hypothetical protein